jgi:hypothetical protein
MLQTRLDHYDDHRNYLNGASIGIVLAGPITADDNETPIGSFFVVSVERREEVEDFNQRDPFYQLNVWAREGIRIHPFLKRRGWDNSV